MLKNNEKKIKTVQKKQNLPTILIENDSARCSDGRLEPIPHTHTLHERPLLACGLLHYTTTL